MLICHAVTAVCNFIQFKITRIPKEFIAETNPWAKVRSSVVCWCRQT